MLLHRNCLHVRFTHICVYRRCSARRNLKNVSCDKTGKPVTEKSRSAKCSRKTFVRAWPIRTRDASDDTGVTDASELTRCRRVPNGDVDGGGFRFSWMVAVPRASNNRAAVVPLCTARTTAHDVPIDKGNGPTPQRCVMRFKMLRKPER